jgi:hypothetical protein
MSHPTNSSSSPAKALRFFQESTLAVVVAADLLPCVSVATHLHYNLRFLLLALLLSLIASPLSRRKRTSLTSLTTCTTFTKTIAAAQHLAWNVAQDLTRQFLIREKRVEEAKAKGRPPPFFRPLFTKVSTHKALFPPSQHVENLAT